MPHLRSLIPLLTLITTACTTVDSGYVGVKTKFGEVQSGVLSEGLHFHWPGHEVVPMDARLQKFEVEAMASSRDLQEVRARVALNYQIVSAEAPRIYQSIGTIKSVEGNLIGPVLQEAIKLATAKYDSAQLIQDRASVKQVIFDYCAERLVEDQIVVRDVSIVNFAFNEGYQKAIEDKQVAQQMAEAATNDLQRIKVEAEQAEAKARGEANALLIGAEAEAKRQKLLGETMTDELIEWKAIEKWDGKLPTVQADGKSIIQVPVQ